MPEFIPVVRAPAAVLRLLGAGARSAPPPQDDAAVPVASDALAWIPRAGDPAIFDAALGYGARLLNEASAGGADRREELRLLVAPGELEVVAGLVTRRDEDLAEDLQRSPPAIAAGAVWVTGHGACALEDSWRLAGPTSYRRPSGKEVPLLRAEGPGDGSAPWRNPELLGRRVAWWGRSELEERLRERRGEPLLQLEGPLGCGKSRLARELLAAEGVLSLTLRCPGSQRRSPLAWQLARELLRPERPGAPRFASEADRRAAAQRWQERGHLDPAATLVELLARVASDGGQPIVVLCDDAERLAGEDLELLAALAAGLDGAAVRLWLAGRPGNAPLPGLGGGSHLWVGPLEPEDHRRLASELARGWGIPEAVLEALCAGAAGHLFALEEGLVALARSQRLRRSWGSFFYAGEEEDPPEYRPSSRLTAHLLAEAARLGIAPQLQALAVADGQGLPPRAVDAALGRGPEGSQSWEQAAVRAGLARRMPGSWGPGVRLACPAYARALERGLTAESARDLRCRLGRQLADEAGDGRAAWHAYRLLRGTPEALQPLLRSARGASEAEAGELMAALRDELAALRERGEDRRIELLVLWRLFQTARRLGRIAEVGVELERALELARDEPERYLAVVNLKAESEQEAGRLRDAERTLLAALAATRTLPRPERRASLMIQLGRTYQQAGRLADAERLFEELHPALQRQGLEELAAACRYHLGNLARRGHRLADAVAHHGAALEVRRELSLDLDVCASLTALGALSAELGNYPKALQHYDEAIALAGRSAAGGRELAFALLGKAKVLGRCGDAVAAASLLRRARELRATREDRPGETIARLAAAQNLFDLGQEDRAFEEAGRARFDLELLSMAARVADADHLLGRIQLRRRRIDEARQHLAAALEAHERAEELEAAAFDEAWLLEAAISTDQAEAVEAAARSLIARRSRLARPELGERLDHRIFRALDWLAARGVGAEDPRPFLERAYEQLLAKAGHLPAAMRHRFFLEVPANREIVEAATRLGIARGVSA